MDRVKFNKEMIKLTETHNVLSQEEQFDIMKESIKRLDSKQRNEISGYHNIIIVIEELGELTKELTKALREKEDITGILEELGDVSIGIDYIKQIFNISNEQLEYSRSIKLSELKSKMDSNPEYS